MDKIPDEASFYFFKAQVDILPQNFTDQFKNCIHIQFERGVVKTIHVSPKLTHIELYSTSTANVIIELGKEYQLEEFTCSNTNLTGIPENISQLKKMKYLSLIGNSIQTVQLDQLQGLDNLESLQLTDNEIKHIHNQGSVSLPSLTNLHLANNRLTHIDVCSWNMPTLSYIDLRFNFLTHFAINQFRVLKGLRISDNPLNCDWMHSLLKSRSDIYHVEELTCANEGSEGVFALDCPMPIEQLRQQNANSMTSSAPVEATVLNNSQQIAELNNKIQKMAALLENLAKKSKIDERFQKIEALLESHNSRIIEQQNVSNDIIEAIYRAEMERTYATEKTP
ncbi:leucine-rich repeat-containing G-protein coupled receptor 4-like [Aedes albopictus]|uniref:Uncharacterized protein n=1 Tax=Aedes albopictus TaxID=7160 RepID=A0ABM1ZIU9_AEDAL